MYSKSTTVSRPKRQAPANEQISSCDQRTRSGGSETDGYTTEQLSPTSRLRFSEPPRQQMPDDLASPTTRVPPAPSTAIQLSPLPSSVVSTSYQFAPVNPAVSTSTFSAQPISDSTAASVQGTAYLHHNGTSHMSSTSAVSGIPMFSENQ